MSLLALVGAPCSSATAAASAAPFDPHAIAAAETAMWRSYYDGAYLALGEQLVTLLKAQFGLSETAAMSVGQQLGLASMMFQQSHGDYDRVVLPHLENAYSQLKTELKAEWNAKQVARAELEWWVARRTPGKNSPENVAKGIAKLYALLYGSSNTKISEAALLRAQAAAQRDRQGAAADWKLIEKTLVKSYESLVRGIQPAK